MKDSDSGLIVSSVVLQSQCCRHYSEKEKCKCELSCRIFLLQPPTPNHRLWNGSVGRTFTSILRRGNTFRRLFRAGRAHGIVLNTSTKTTESRNTSWITVCFCSCRAVGDDFLCVIQLLYQR